MTFLEFVAAVFDGLRQSVSEAQFVCDGARVICSWDAGLLEAEPVDGTSCRVRAHSRALKTAAEAAFKLRADAVRLVVDFALLLKRPETGRTMPSPL